MSILIDSIVNQNVKESINNNWHIAKALNYNKEYNPITIRIKWAWEVFRGKAIAVHFKRDEQKGM